MAHAHRRMKTLHSIRTLIPPTTTPMRIMQELNQTEMQALPAQFSGQQVPLLSHQAALIGTDGQWDQDVALFEKQCHDRVAELGRMTNSDDQIAFALVAEDELNFKRAHLLQRHAALRANGQGETHASPEKVEMVYGDFIRALDSTRMDIDPSVGYVIQPVTRDPSSVTCIYCGHDYGSTQRFAGNCFHCGNEGCIGCMTMAKVEGLEKHGAKLVCCKCLQPVVDALAAVSAGGSGHVARTAAREREALIMASKSIVPAGTGRAILDADTLSAAAKGVQRCGCCAESFSVVKPPRVCTKCRKPVCGADSDDFYLLALIGQNDNACYCRACIASTVPMLEEMGKKNFYLLRPAKKEKARVDALLARPKGRALLPAAVQSQACPLCSRSFVLTRSPMTCTACQTVVCCAKECGGHVVLSSNENLVVFVCRACADTAEISNVLPLPFAGGVPLLKRLEPEKKCGICKASFSLIRRRQECYKCEMVICGGCCDGTFMSPVLGVNHYSTCCRACMRSVKEELLEIIDSDPIRKGSAAAELKTVTTFLEMPKSKAELKMEELNQQSSSFCGVCQAILTPANVPAKCATCDRFACPSCRSKVQYKALGWIEARELCNFCLQTPKDDLRDLALCFSDANLTFPATAAELSVEEVTAASSGVLKCSVCNHAFKSTSPPARCGLCSFIVCNLCSFAHLHAPILLQTRTATVVCRNCWSGSARTAFQNLAVKRPNLSGAVTAQLRLGDQLVGKVAPDPRPDFSGETEHHCYICSQVKKDSSK